MTPTQSAASSPAHCSGALTRREAALPCLGGKASVVMPFVAVQVQNIGNTLGSEHR
jgi:hypothetical protein